MSLSAIIIVQTSLRESPLLKRAEKSVSFADEVLIFRHPDRIMDFSAVRNEALDQAKGEWVLFVDSDEEVTAALAEEIQQVARQSAIRNPQSVNGFMIRRIDYFLGRWLKYGETGHIRFLRFARKNAGMWARPVHEQWVVNGSVGTLRHPLLHRPHQSGVSMLEKIERYAEIEAQFLHRNKQRSMMRIIIEMMVFPKAKFIQNYLFRLGFLDGFPGLIMALMMSFHSFLMRAHMLDSLVNKRLVKTHPRHS